MSYTEQLYKLQELDKKIMAANKRLAEISASLIETDILKAAKESYKKAEQTHLALKTKQTDLDLEVKGLQQKISQHENRLYSGKLVNPKEASSLQEEIDSVKRWLAKKEEDLLDLMINFEEAEETLEDCKKTLDNTQAAWEDEQADLIKEQGNCQAYIDEVTKSRATVAQFIDEDDLARYETLRQQKMGIGLTVVEDDVCTSCGVMLSSRLVQQVSSDDQLYFCDSCARILYIA